MVFVVGKMISRIKNSAKNYSSRFSYVGLIVAMLFFAASVTPSLLPRNFIVQGFLSGFALAVGYGLGYGAVWLYLYFELRQPSERAQLVSKRWIALIVGIFFLVCLRQMAYWQNSIRDLMELEPLETAYPIRTSCLALLLGAGLVELARSLARSYRYVSKRLNHIVPQRVASVGGATIVVVMFLLLVDGVIVRALWYVADDLSLRADELIEEGFEKPESQDACGSQASLVAWESIGRQGKKFLLEGPTQKELGEFWQQPCKQPLRVYVGMRTCPTAKERAELALEELKRVGAFERRVLVVATPTGTGWLDPGAVDTLEYLHRGDTAIVSTQYSYLPSWITILVDSRLSIRSGQFLFEKVYAHWKTLPKDQRPLLYLHGLSLGSLGSEVSASLYRIFEDPIQGAVWSGPPFPSTQWAAVTRGRREGSPAWLPKFGDGALLRFTSQENALNTGERWGPIRNVYVQYASDPMVFFSPDLLWKRPEWLIGPRGPDVSPHLRWIPIITFLQVAFDLPMATSIPIGFGHNYSPSSYIDAWIAVTDPPDWDADQTVRLKEIFRPDRAE